MPRVRTEFDAPSPVDRHATAGYCLKALIVSLLMAASVISAEEPSASHDHRYAELMSSEDVRTYFRRMIQYSSRELEVAAFLIREQDGTIKLLPWPNHGQYRGAKWTGPIPSGAVAIAHTHPNGWFIASAHDIDQARRTGLPIFVLTRKGVSVADPESGKNLILKRGRF